MNWIFILSGFILGLIFGWPVFYFFLFLLALALVYVAWIIFCEVAEHFLD